MQNNDADIKLWAAYVSGDKAAFAELFKRYYQAMLRFGSGLTTNRELLKDNIQEVFVELWQQQDRAEVQSVRAYLFKALKYKLYRDHRRAIQRGLLAEDSALELSYESLLIAGEEDRARTHAVAQALDSLPARQKEIIYLKFYQGLSYEEVSDVMDINYQAARNLLYQAVKTLRGLILICLWVVSRFAA